MTVVAHRSSHGLASLRAARALWPERTEAVGLDGCAVTARFDRLAEALVKVLGQHAAAFVACGWLEHPDIIAALTRQEHGGVICSKESIFRVGVGDDPTLPKTQQDRLRRLQPLLMTRVRVAGLHPLDQLVLTNRNGLPVERVAGLRSFGALDHMDLHHKFVVLADLGVDGQGGVTYEPQRVWTGSFNFTQGATGRCENAVEINHPGAAAAYLREWCQLLVLSEPIPFQFRAFKPEWTASRLDCYTDEH